MDYEFWRAFEGVESRMGRVEEVLRIKRALKKGVSQTGDMERIL